MFRKYTPKDDVQKKAAYHDRFHVVPTLAKEPIEGKVKEDVDALAQAVGVLESFAMRGQAIAYIDAAKNKEALAFLKEQCGYQVLIELSAIDWLATKGKFEIFYEMLSISGNKRLRVKCFIDEKEAIESVACLYSSADWQEREMFDMYGIHANNHPNLVRVIMPDDWVGHPLLKTYPLEGDEHAQWYEVDKIYGKEYRDVIGPENRDPARVDRYDTERFARIGKEVPFGAEPKEGETPIQYQDRKRPVLNDDFDPAKQKTHDERF